MTDNSLLTKLMTISDYDLLSIINTELIQVSRRKVLNAGIQEIIDEENDFVRFISDISKKKSEKVPLVFNRRCIKIAILFVKRQGRWAFDYYNSKIEDLRLRGIESIYLLSIGGYNGNFVKKLAENIAKNHSDLHMCWERYFKTSSKIQKRTVIRLTALPDLEIVGSQSIVDEVLSVDQPTLEGEELEYPSEITNRLIRGFLPDYKNDTRKLKLPVKIFKRKN